MFNKRGAVWTYVLTALYSSVPTALYSSVPAALYFSVLISNHYFSRNVFMKGNVNTCTRTWAAAVPTNMNITHRISGGVRSKIVFFIPNTTFHTYALAYLVRFLFIFPFLYKHRLFGESEKRRERLLDQQSDDFTAARTRRAPHSQLALSFFSVQLQLLTVEILMVKNELLHRSSSICMRGQS